MFRYVRVRNRYRGCIGGCCQTLKPDYGKDRLMDRRVAMGVVRRGCCRAAHPAGAFVPACNNARTAARGRRIRPLRPHTRTVPITAVIWAY